MSAPRPKARPPLIPERYIDVPSQRLYVLSLGLLCQAIKIFDLAQYILGYDQTGYLQKWLWVDFAYCVSLAQLRIPRLNYSKSVVVLQILSLWLLDGLMFGGIRVNGGADTADELSHRTLASTPSSFGLSDVLSSIPGLGMLVSPGEGDKHLLGQHTVRMSPISTAQLHLEGQTFCLATPGDSVLIPVLFNNSEPTSVRYSLSPLGSSVQSGKTKGTFSKPKTDVTELSAKELKAIESARAEALQLTRSVTREVDDDEYDDDDETESTEGDLRSSYSWLQTSQSIFHIRVNKPGTLRLERVAHASGVDARLAYPSEVKIAPCPSAEFVEDNTRIDDTIRCAGEDPDFDIKIRIYGVPPLSLGWFRETNGQRESFVVQGIEGTHEESTESLDMAPQTIEVPLTVSVVTLGTHLYSLESVTDGLGNHVTLRQPPAITNSRYTKQMTVLRRPSVSFRKCAPGKPAYLLIGSEASLPITAHDVDDVDAPLSVKIRFEPSEGAGKVVKPWTKTILSQDMPRDFHLAVKDAGTYTIEEVHGRYCEGDVLNPDVCPVVELPKPVAEIEWRRIHECSGDTGVAASLVLHGTPPFQVYYRAQRDRETARELVKTFQSARGELTLQPEHSGHYTYSFIALSDANYKRVTLNGPSIDQTVHPLASVDFSQPTSGGRKRQISSCSGHLVNVDVELKGTGPWTVEYQIVSATRTDTITATGIQTSKASLEVPIPASVDTEGGFFNIDLVSVEDSSGCKRTVSVPGITVNVRRVQPTVKFYGRDDKRHLTVLERDLARLPLRLTGDGPWRVEYRLQGEPERIRTATVSGPNDYLQVTEPGTYELLNVRDSQCPGTVHANDATYAVDWVPRPFAALAKGTEATYEAYNGSYILPPVCEHTPDHIDLDLTGRPPFEITYNIARPSDMGGSVLIGQPTFSSIQPSTRFQLLTSDAGRIYYEVKQIGDAAYPLEKHKDTTIPRASRLLFEQEVLRRPSARFETTNRMSHCLGDALVPSDAASEGVIVLEGTPPFIMNLSVHNLAASEISKHTIKIRSKIWKVEIPDYHFNTIGPHRITIDSVQDASHCEQVVLDPSSQSAMVDIVESAAIVPFDRKEHYCVGEVSQFQLEGIPPWTIGYRINGKSHSQNAIVSPFSLVQQQPGEFVVTSIAHQQQMCKTSVADLRYTVHPLPSAQVGHGKRILQDIHEGDQAEIVFTLLGEPPFTFTYQRAETVNVKKAGRPGKVLETHTVSGVNTHEYSIFSASEGTWTVTFIADRYCRYPFQDSVIRA
ncbi:hypothetical protein PUNSTDRAFT_140355 [Punctularia strigosozonata HHB-11173 SS5]|uniref:uncharacterized protein n=1 Tax=Punctularia strigosozonata (strain HHB-11173) TaxID=741275 RepID=UPI0004417A27|nr:uncharacterized protein PUNSTDRAFT_140355 [Punctularia strigosozonata HHB-11173 SS5]EIN13930.1 hypothetical protein PUNSTDRAFT_140355 [Punctularia strigosozonata HHB-11173 SS5]